MASDVSVSFGADASELLAALKEVDADLKQMIESFGGVARASGQMKGLTAATKEWEQAFRPIDRAFSQSISGIIRGTQTAHQAIAKFGQSLTASFIDDAEKSVTKWAASDLAKTTATQVGVAARRAAQDSDSSVGLIKLVDLTLKSIGVDASKTFADVFAFFASSLGPAAAGPAAAAQASVLAVGADIATAEVGMWNVPEDMFSFVHRGEAILPADYASGFRAAAAGGGMGGPSAHFSIQAMDGASVQRVLGNNHGAVAAALRRAWRQGSSHLR